jgi:hypothetical protein
MIEAHWVRTLLRALAAEGRTVLEYQSAGATR